MAFYKKSKLHTGTALICSLAIVFSALPVYATDTIDNLQNQTSALENELKGINQDILTLSEKISDTEMQVEILNSELSPNSFKQWKRLMIRSGEISSLIFSLMY